MVGTNQGILKGEVSLYRWPPVWLVWNQLYDNWIFLFLFAKQTYPNQSNRRSAVQWYFPLKYSLDKHTILFCCSVNDKKDKFCNFDDVRFAGILGMDDLVKIDPQRGHFLQKLQELAAQKQNVLATFDETEENDEDLDSNSKFSKALEKLTIEHNGHEIKLDDLQLTFQYSPSSAVFKLERVNGLFLRYLMKLGKI